MQIASPSLSAAAAPLLIVIFVGMPGSGKSTFSRALMAAGSPQPPLGTCSWRHVSQDLLGSRKKCIAATERALSIRMNVVFNSGYSYSHPHVLGALSSELTKI